MKLLLILALVIMASVLLLIFSGRKAQRQEEKNKKCLTVDNFILIRDSPVSSQIGKYEIHLKDNELRFTRKGEGYTLFYLKLEEETSTVKLVGLDGYGVRDRAFLKDVCELISKVKDQQPE